MPAPIDPVSNFIIQHNLLPLLWPSVAVSAIMKARKVGSAMKRVTLEALQGFEEIHGRFCDCWARCSLNWHGCKTQRAENRRPKALARRAGAD